MTASFATAKDPQHAPHSSIDVAVPGKIMLAGEYAVLLGGRALASTVDLQLNVGLEADPDLSGVRVSSNLWPEARTLPPDADPTQWVHEPLLETVAFAAQKHQLDGYKFTVRSQLDTSFGIGSSSALRLGILLAAQASRAPLTVDAAWEAASDAYNLQRQAQKRASGYDIATQLIGGLVSFLPAKDNEQWPGDVACYSDEASTHIRTLVHPFIGGRGAPTAPVMRDTLTWLGEHNLFSELFDASENLVAAFTSALSSNKTSHDVQRLIVAAAEHRQILAGSPHFPTALANALAALPGFDEQWTFKTTGAGGEDAILLIGPTSALAQAHRALFAAGWAPLPTMFSSAGALPQNPRLNQQHITGEAAL